MADRIQLKRARGWRLPEGAVSVARPGKWGNPYTVEGAIEHGVATAKAEGQRVAVAYFRTWITRADPADQDVYVTKGRRYDRRWMRDHLRELRGHDLACWCDLPAPGQPDICHAAVLLELAGGPCDLCRGYCTNGAECAVSQYLGKPLDWRSGKPAECTP